MWYVSIPSLCPNCLLTLAKKLGHGICNVCAEHYENPNCLVCDRTIKTISRNIQLEMAGEILQRERTRLKVSTTETKRKFILENS